METGEAASPEHADETPPRELSGQRGHQLDSRPHAISAATDAMRRKFVAGPKGVGEDGVKIAKKAPPLEGGPNGVLQGSD